MKFAVINKTIPKQPPECDIGNREYKLHLANYYIINNGFVTTNINSHVFAANLTAKRNGHKFQAPNSIRVANTSDGTERYIPKRMMRLYTNTSDHDKYMKRTTQMMYRLIMGGGKAIYMIGVLDNGATDGIDLALLYQSIIYIIRVTELSSNACVVKSVRIYKGQQRGKFVATIRIECAQILDNTRQHYEHDHSHAHKHDTKNNKKGIYNTQGFAIL